MKNLVVILAFCAAAGCGQLKKSVAIGGDDQIIVIADSANWSRSKETLQIVFERTFITPQKETDFYLQYASGSVFETYKKYKYIVMIGTLDSDEPVSQTVRGMLTEEARRAVQSGEYFVFTRQDEWSIGQTLMVLTSDNIQNLTRQIQDNGDQLYEIFDRHKTRLMADFLYGTSAPLEDKTLQEELYRKYGWTMRIHPDYKMVEEKPDSHYVRFHATSMYKSLQRWISVYWELLDSGAAPDSFLTRNWMIQTRNKIGSLFLDPVKTTPAFDKFHRAKMDSVPVLVYSGIWKTTNVENAFGGPFRSYALYDAASGRIYFLDQALFFPEETKKLKFLRELDVITRTFSTKPPEKK
jgi:hypothetical protein